jgi:hypothetical protein
MTLRNFARRFAEALEEPEAKLSVKRRNTKDMPLTPVVLLPMICFALLGCAGVPFRTPDPTNFEGKWKAIGPEY